jgi:hypothetical protein
MFATLLGETQHFLAHNQHAPRYFFPSESFTTEAGLGQNFGRFLVAQTNSKARVLELLGPKTFLY